MTVQSDMALLAAGSYWDLRGTEQTPVGESNRTPLPAGWTLLPQYDISRSGAGSSLLGDGFSARVYQGPGGQIVISLAGTEFGASASGFIADFISGNIPLAIGRYAEQAYQAADLYQRVKADPTLSDSISFTGHSLGGGLAAVMAVWFNRPAYVFAAAPFQLSADSWQSTVIPDAISALVLPRVRFKLGASIDPALAAYDPSLHFAARESNVQAWAVKGEVLEANLGGFNWIEGASTALYNNPANSLSSLNKHLIDLHAAALITPNFETQANKVPTALERLFDGALYGYAVTGNQQNILVKLIRNEVGVRSDGGTILLAPNAMLTHFAADLQKLGANIAGLSKQAQDALIAQGIEWYYWQVAGYAGAEFFASSASAQPGLLQYTTAQGDALTGALDKAAPYVRKWLAPIASVHGSAYFLTYGASNDQWNVVTSASGATVSARDNGKSQVFVGQAGADNFTGGDKGDLMFAGAGNDTLNGGAGNDMLFGGAGSDNYQFSGGFGLDIVVDSDGLGSIGPADGGQALSGGKQIAASVWESDDKQYRYAQAEGHLIVSMNTPTSGGLNGAIMVRSWSSNGHLGINLAGTAEAPVITNTLSGDFVKATNPAGTEYLYSGDGNYASAGPQAGAADQITGGAGADQIFGGAGDDALLGRAGNDSMEGGAGNGWNHADSCVWRTA